MPMTVKWSNFKPEVDFQYGGPLFLATGSSNISAVDCDIWSKFGMQIVLTFVNVRCHKNQKAKVDLGRYGRHMAAILENLHNVITLSLIVQFG